MAMAVASPFSFVTKNRKPHSLLYQESEHDCLLPCSIHTHALVMAGRVTVIVLVVVVFVGALGLASATDCVEPDEVVEEGEEDKLIYVKNETQPQNATSTSLYVKLGVDFDGVCVKVEGERLKKCEKCFEPKKWKLNNTTWNLLKVEAKVLEDTFGKLQVEFNLIVDDYEDSKQESNCETKNITRLSVTAYGASEWLLNASENQSNGPPDACPNPTTDKLTSASSPEPVLAVIIVLPVVVVAGVIIWKRQRRLSASQRVLRCIQSTSRGDTDTSYSGQVVENSLYEPLPGPVTPAARQEQPGTVLVIENSMYEPLPSPVTPAVRQEQPGTVQVIENSLYEPLPGPDTPAARQE